jgi:hypothetical protein
VAQVGAVHGQRADAGGHGKRGPGGEAEVSVNDVQARARTLPRAEPAAAYKAPAQCDRRGRQSPGARRELVELDVHVVQLAQGGDLIANEAPALGMGRVGEHVRDHERAHGPFDRIALE